MIVPWYASARNTRARNFYSRNRECAHNSLLLALSWQNSQGFALRFFFFNSHFTHQSVCQCLPLSQLHRFAFCPQIFFITTLIHLVITSCSWANVGTGRTNGTSSESSGQESADKEGKSASSKNSSEDKGRPREKIQPIQTQKPTE